MRNGESIFWFDCRTPRILEAPPDRDRFKGLIHNDLFISWGDKEAGCRVWKARVARRAGDLTWDPIEWGELDSSTLRYFVITNSGQPSWVEKTTWERSYRRYGPRMMYADGSEVSSGF